jgi:ribosomal protein S8
MKIKLLIASGDTDYAEHLSDNISERHADAVVVSVCRTSERLREILPAEKYDAALLEASLIEDADLQSIKLPLLLVAEDEDAETGTGELKRVLKYQRISTLVATVLENYSEISTNKRRINSKKASITAVWSPAGGVGKTAVALAQAAKKQAEGKQALYLDLEPFSSVPAYFGRDGKSISTVFEMRECKHADSRS